MQYPQGQSPFPSSMPAAAGAGGAAATPSSQPPLQFWGTLVPPTPSTAGRMDMLPPSSNSSLGGFGIAGEPPLLEELGINFSHILAKTTAVLHPFKRTMSSDILEDSDLAGPLIFVALFGMLLLVVECSFFLSSSSASSINHHS